MAIVLDCSVCHRGYGTSSSERDPALCSLDCARAALQTAEARLRLAEGLAESVRDFNDRLRPVDYTRALIVERGIGALEAYDRLRAALAAWEGTDGTRG